MTLRLHAHVHAISACMQLGNLDAPVGQVVVGFMHVANAAAIAAELGDVGNAALVQATVRVQKQMPLRQVIIC